jgi:hypothetical protein
MKNIFYSLSVIVMALLIANPLSLWAGADDEELLRIEKARERNWSPSYSTNPPALKQLSIYDAANKTDADIDFITTCPNLENLSITIEEKDLGKIARLTRLEELDLWRSSLQGDGLARLACLTNLHTLEINDCELSEKAYESLGSLDQIRTLVINPLILLKFRHLDSLSQMKSLQTIAIEEAYLWDLSKLEKQKLANDLARLKVSIVNRPHHGAILDVENSDPPPARLFYANRYSTMQLKVAIFAWHLIPWLGLFSVVVIVVSMVIVRSRAQWAICACSYLPRFGLFGYSVTVVITLFVLLVLIPRRPYPAQMSGGDFWAMISKGIGQTNSVHKLPSLLAGKRHCFFLISGLAGHGYRTLCAVPNQEVTEHFPRFLDQALQDGKLSDLQLESLSDRSVSASNRLEIISQMRAKGFRASDQPRAIRQYLATLEWESLSSCRKHVGFEFDRRLQLEKDVADWEDRSSHYWVTVTFEIVFFWLLLSLFWVPLLKPSLFRFAYRFWAMIPLLLAAPYQLGYCYLIDHPHMGTADQGILYPMILGHCQPFFNWSIILIRWYYHIPGITILEKLNQPFILDEEYYGEYVYTLGAIIISFAFWLIGGWLMKKAFSTKKTEGAISSEQEKHVTAQEGATDKPDLPEERTTE